MLAGIQASWDELQPCYPFKMPKHHDAYGSELMAVFRGNRNTLEIFEREDGLREKQPLALSL